MFYFVSVTTLLLVLPLLSIAADLLIAGGGDVWFLIGKWFTFWGAGARLFIAGLMQVTKPQFTSASIFGIGDPAAFAIVREIGFGNLAMGTLGLASLVVPEWLAPAAIVGGLYYGLAGIGHAVRGERNAKEQFALASDLGVCIALAVFLATRALG